ncbi:uncharacterized protein LOC130015449 isoform X2 [Mercurialis annua]|nr:uncharacterized protein LOC130015449 isoform X2 [Mercurialis annua]
MTRWNYVDEKLFFFRWRNNWKNDTICKSSLAHFARIKHLLQTIQASVFCVSSQLQRKIEKAARELSKLNSAWAPTELDADLEMMTEEERECLRKICLKMHQLFA